MRVSVFADIFSMYLAPHLEATITADPASSSCTGIEIKSEFAIVVIVLPYVCNVRQSVQHIRTFESCCKTAVVIRPCCTVPMICRF
jgi:hypothetical protein